METSTILTGAIHWVKDLQTETLWLSNYFGQVHPYHLPLTLLIKCSPPCLPTNFTASFVFFISITTWVRHVPMCMGLQPFTVGWATYLQPLPQGHWLVVPHNSSQLPTVPQTGVGNLGVPPLSTLEFWFQFYFYLANFFKIMIYVKL